MRCWHSVNMIQYLVFICELSVVSKVCHRVWMSHRIVRPLTWEECEALSRFSREILLDLQGIIDINVPVLFLDVPNELIKRFDLFEIGHGPDEDELHLCMWERCVKATDCHEVYALLVMFDTRDNDDVFCKRLYLINVRDCDLPFLKASLQEYLLVVEGSDYCNLACFNEWRWIGIGLNFDKVLDYGVDDGCLKVILVSHSVKLLLERFIQKVVNVNEDNFSFRQSQFFEPWYAEVAYLTWTLTDSFFVIQVKPLFCDLRISMLY